MACSHTGGYPVELYAILLGFVAIIILLSRTSKLRSELDEAKRHISFLLEQNATANELAQNLPDKKASTAKGQARNEETPALMPQPEEKLEAILATPVAQANTAIQVPLETTKHEEHPTKPASSKPEPIAKEESYFRSESWKRTERFILENLTGILGTLGVVLGLGFLAVYTALLLAPVFRVLLLATFSLIVVVIGAYFLRKGRWRGLAQWLQSAGLAVFLLACLGSGGIPGLHWINDPLLAWGLLTIGVLANLGLAFLRKSPVFASVHAVLSLAALAVAGSSPIIVATMTLVAIGSLLLIRGKNWELHLGITESVFVGILLLFYFMGPKPSELLRYLATTGVVLVFVVGQASHYKKMYATSSWDWPAVFTHLLVWGLTCAGLFLYAPQHDKVLAPCLLLVSLIVGLAARFARRRGILWLHKIDTLFSLASAFGSVLGLLAWQVALTPAVLLALLVSLAFTLLMVIEREALLAKIGTRMTEILSLIVAGLAIGGADALALGIAGLLIGVFQAIMVHRLQALDCPQSLYDVILPWLFVISALVLPNGQIIPGLPSGYGLLLPLLGLFVWRRFRTSKLLSLGLLTASTAFSLKEMWTLLYGLLTGHSDPNLAILVTLPLILIPLLGLLVCKKDDYTMRRPLLWSFGINLALSVLIVLWKVMPAMIPPVWLLLGILLLWAPSLKKTVLAREITILGLALVLGSLFTYIPLVLAGLVAKTGSSLRWVIETVFILLLLSSYQTRLRREPTGDTDLDNIQSLFLDISILVFLATVFFEIPGSYLALAISVGATILLLLSSIRAVPRRLVSYSYLTFILSCLLMVWTAMTRTGGPEFWLSVPVQLIWLNLIFRLKWPNEQDFPQHLRWLSRFSAGIVRHISLVSVIPLGVTWALSLGYRFDSTLLTLLWSLESFGIFVLALILKKPVFRTISMAALGICLVRLVFFDLVQADTLSRALVFIGLGLLLILMNILYIKFKSRVATVGPTENKP